MTSQRHKVAQGNTHGTREAQSRVLTELWGQTGPREEFPSAVTPAARKSKRGSGGGNPLLDTHSSVGKGSKRHGQETEENSEEVKPGAAGLLKDQTPRSPSVPRAAVI